MSDPTSASLDPQDAYQELARITLADHSLETIMEKLAALAKGAVPGASEVSVTMLEGLNPITVASTGRLAVELDKAQYDRGQGPCLSSVEAGELVVLNDLAANHSWTDWAQDAIRAGAGSSLSVPVPVQRDISAALNIYSTAKNAFDEHAAEIATTLAAHGGVALANMHLYQAQGKVAEQLQTAMRSRATIEQAKGILMGQRGCSAEEAFQILSKLSQDSNRKLREVAQALVEQSIGRPARVEPER